MEREREREERDREREMEQREKEAEYYSAWEKQEDTVSLKIQEFMLCTVVYIRVFYVDLRKLSSLIVLTQKFSKNVLTVNCKPLNITKSSISYIF